MKTSFLLLFLSISIFSFSQPICGADQTWKYLKKLRGKRVACMVNQTSTLTYKQNPSIHLVDYLINQNINIQVIFAPEHGFEVKLKPVNLLKMGLIQKQE
jgi:uncharacterized protein YbbC (DUF1343 family)